MSWAIRKLVPAACRLPKSWRCLPPYQFRSLAAASETASTGDSPDDLMKSKIVRVFAAIFMLTASVRVLPWAAAGAVDHTVKLLDAKEPFLISAGISRLKFLSRLEAAARQAAITGAVPRLLRLIDCPDNDGGLRQSALETLVAVASVPEGEAALVEAGGEAVLRRITGKVGNEDREVKRMAEELIGTVWWKRGR